MPENGNVLMLMYDLPCKTKTEQRKYRKFVSSIMKTGFLRLQESVFIKQLHNKKSTSLEIARIRRLAGNNGRVMLLPLPMSTFVKMETVAGVPFDFSPWVDDVIEV